MTSRRAQARRNIEDAEIVREVGLHQDTRRPLTLKTLFLQGIGSAATIQRRLTRLKRLRKTLR